MAPRCPLQDHGPPSQLQGALPCQAILPPAPTAQGTINTTDLVLCTILRGVYLSQRADSTIIFNNFASKYYLFCFLWFGTYPTRGECFSSLSLGLALARSNGCSWHTVEQLSRRTLGQRKLPHPTVCPSGVGGSPHPMTGQ